MVLNVHLMRYLWEVREELPGNRRQKKQILSRVESSVRDFVIENSGADYNAIVSRFGLQRRSQKAILQKWIQQSCWETYRFTAESL